jgi:hypothetical protein
VGWWRKTAEVNGDDPVNPLQRLMRDAMFVFTGAISLLFMLVGLGRLLVRAPGDSMLVSLLLVGIAIAAVPFWWSALTAGKSSQS